MNEPPRLDQTIEQGRQAQITTLVADYGDDWANGYLPGTNGCHELLDRTSIIGDMLESHILEHPACIANPEWYQLAEQATTLLRELYQRVGAEHLS